MEYILAGENEKINFQLLDPKQSNVLLILAHGAGAGMNHPYMQSLASLFHEKGMAVLLFNFPYLEAGRKSPGSPRKNIEAWKAVLTYASTKFRDRHIFIGGKSYGGRMASHTISDASPKSVKGLIYVGFPLHAPGKESIERATHLSDVNLPQLFLQGTKDTLARESLIRSVVDKLENSRVHFFQDADHSFSVPKKSGKTNGEVLAELVTVSCHWIAEIGS